MLCACNEAFFFFCPVSKFFFKKKKTKFVLKTWISRRVFYFVGILSGVGDIILPRPQVFSLLIIWFRSVTPQNHKQ